MSTSKQREAVLKGLDLCDLPLSPLAGAPLEMTSLRAGSRAGWVSVC